MTFTCLEYWHSYGFLLNHSPILSLY